MKFKIRWGLIPMALLCLVSSCNELPEPITLNTQKLPEITSIEPAITSKLEIVNGVLSFEDGDAFDELVVLLNDGDEKWQDEFLMQATGLMPGDLQAMSTEALESLSEALEMAELEAGIAEDHYFAAFESSLGFSSLRALIAEREEKFLDQVEPDWNEDPDDHFIHGTAERALINERGEIMVGGKLYKFMANGLIYEVTDGDFETLSKIGDEYAEVLFEAPNVVAYNVEVLEGGRGNCRTWVRDSQSWNYDSDTKRMKAILGHRSLIFSNQIFATVKHYKRKRNRWKKSRAYLKTQSWGSYGDSDPGNYLASCKDQVDFKSRLKSKFRRRITVRYQTMGWGFGKIESGKVHGFFEANGFAKYQTLIF